MHSPSPSRSRSRSRAGGAALLVCTVLCCGCGKTPIADTPITAAESELIRSLCLDESAFATPPPSPGNKHADDLRAAELGRKLFFDKRMSANGEVACATCHDPRKFFTDGLDRAQGIGKTPRSAPTIVGGPWLPFVFWDGRKDSLWSQALGPIEADIEHGFSRTGVAHHLKTHYKSEYEAIFGPLPTLQDKARFPSHARPVDDDSGHAHNKAWAAMSAADQLAINTVFANFGKAVEAYERKILPRAAPFDAFACSVKSGAAPKHPKVSDAAIRGLRAFIGPAGCVNCHNGPMLTDEGFHNLGLPGVPGVSGVDVGRTLGAGKVKADPFSCGGTFSDAEDCDELTYLNPRFEDFVGAFKTPTLRNVATTAPYMHAGQLKTLPDVLKHYKELPGKARIGHRDLVLRQIDPDVSAEDIIAFLKTLTGPLRSEREDHWLKGPQ